MKLSQNLELLKEWNYNKNSKNPCDIDCSSGKKYWWKCEKGHEWQAIIKSRVRGNGCPNCANFKRRKNKVLT